MGDREREGVESGGASVYCIGGCEINTICS